MDGSAGEPDAAHGHGEHAAEAAGAPAPAAAAPAAAPAVPGEEGDVEIISSGDDYSEDSQEQNTFGGLFGETSEPPDAAMIRLHHMERQHEQLADTVDSMQTQLAGVLSSQAQLTDHVSGLERGLATVVTQQQTATADAAALRGDIQALLGHLTGGTLNLPPTAPPATTKEEPAAEPVAAAVPGPSDQPGQAALPTGPLGADKGKDKGRSAQEPY